MSLFKAHEDYILPEVLALDWQQYEAEQNHIFDQIEGSFSSVLHDEE